MPAEIAGVFDLGLETANLPLVPETCSAGRPTGRVAPLPVESVSGWPPGPALNMSMLRFLFAVSDNKRVAHSATSVTVFEVASPFETFNPSDVLEFEQISSFRRRMCRRLLATQLRLDAQTGHVHSVI